MPTPVTPSDQRTSCTGAATQSTEDVGTSPPLSSAMRIYGAKYADVQNHLLSVKCWTQQLTSKLRTPSIDDEDRHRIYQALSILHRLQQQCLAFQDLLVACEQTHSRPEHFHSRDRLYPNESGPESDGLFLQGTSDKFKPIPDYLQARPSVFTPSCRQFSSMESSLRKNYCHSLYAGPTDTSIEAPTRRMIFKMQHAPALIQETSLDKLIKEFTDTDLPEERSKTSGPHNR